MNGIGVREAARKYGVPHRTLSGWIADGLIRVLQRPAKRGQAMLVYEADVAQLARHYRPGRSRWQRPQLPRVHAA
jgi:predicted site-specific integrase-resolvase